MLYNPLNSTQLSTLSLLIHSRHKIIEFEYFNNKIIRITLLHFQWSSEWHGYFLHICRANFVINGGFVGPNLLNLLSFIFKLFGSPVLFRLMILWLWRVIPKSMSKSRYCIIVIMQETWCIKSLGVLNDSLIMRYIH